MTNTLSLFLLSSILLPTSIATASKSPPQGIEYGEVICKRLSGPDRDGDLDISVKVTVRNRSENDVEIDISVRAIDGEDFEVLDLFLDGLVRAGETRVLTDSYFLNEQTYKTISRWEIEDD